MTAAELIEVLEDLPEDTEVRIASQPSWPFEYSVRSVVTSDDADDVAWIVEDVQLGYLDGSVADEAWAW